jgi:mannose-1-phosphate guanylyltransferase
MKAIVLAAGFGTRLKPLTENRSKVTLALAEVPVVVRVIRLLRDFGVDEIAVNLHHAPDSVREAVESCGERVTFSHETEILGTGGALWGARDFLAGSRVLMINGDCYYGAPDLGAALRFHESRGSLATMVLVDMPKGENYRGVETAPDGRLLKIAGRPESNKGGCSTLHFTGIHILEPEYLGRIGAGFSDINSRHHVEAIAAGLPVFGYHTNFPCYDLGTPSRFLAAARELIQAGDGGLAPERTVIIGPGCEIDPTATITGPAELGAGCRLGAGCKVERAVLLEGVTLEPGSRVVDSLLGDGVRVTDGMSLQNAAVADVNGEIVVNRW